MHSNDAQMLVLTVLADGPMHGYAINTPIERLTGRWLGLYPRPIRVRWGIDLEAEIRTAGWRRLPGILAGIADLWPHPAIWPDASPRRRRLRMTTMTVAVALACWFVSLVTVELGGRPAHAAGHSSLMSAGMSLILAGLASLAPRIALLGLLTAFVLVLRDTHHLTTHG